MLKYLQALCVMLVLTLVACNSNNANPLIGKAAPGFSLQNAEGGTISLSDFAGKPVLLYFHMAVG